MKDIQTLSETELHEKLAELRQTYSDAKRSHAAGELANPRELTKTRRDIARVKTSLAAKIATKGKDEQNA